MNRRTFLALSPLLLRGQGVSSRNVKAQPRGKPSGLPFQARFTDVAAEAGLRAPVIYGTPDRKPYILETVGCGCAFLDYDNDGWMDILLLTGSSLEAPPKEATLRLYKNRRDGTFTDVTDQAGLRRTVWASGVTVGDYNNDGFEDIFIACWGENILFRNNGDGTFRDVTKQAGLIHGRNRWGSGCTWIDYNRDGHLDLMVGNYLVFDPARVPKPGENGNCMWKGLSVNCGPRGLPFGDLQLYRNNGNGTFTDVSAESGIGRIRGSYPMTAVCADFDGDGWSDLYVACDSTPSHLLRNNGNGTFTDIGLEAGVALNEDGVEQAGMGIGIGDFNNDGVLDLVKTHFADDTCILYRNDGKGNFDDVTVRSGLGVETRFVSWGAGMVDLDNDGLQDLFWVTGSVYPEIERVLSSHPYRTPRVVFRNLGGGRFEELIDEAGPGIGELHSSRGCAFGDFDNDGDVDILIVNMGEPPSLLRNDLQRKTNWLKVLLEGTRSNRSAIGATVIATFGGKRQAQARTAQSSFYSANDPRLHFGLGEAASADLEIRWPNGGRQVIRGVAANQVLRVKEAS